jgi:hypothetical protein
MTVLAASDSSTGRMVSMSVHLEEYNLTFKSGHHPEEYHDG